MSISRIESADFWKTSDLPLATVISLWFPLDSLEKASDSKVFFYFKRDERLDELVQAYWKKELQVEPQTYFIAMKLLKARIHQEMSNGKGGDY